MVRFAFIHSHFSAFLTWVLSVCYKQLKSLLIHSIEQHTVLRSSVSSLKNWLSWKRQTLRVVPFISYVQISSETFFSPLKERAERVETCFLSDCSRFPLEWDRVLLYLYIYVFCDFCIDVSAKKRKKWKVIADPNTTINSQMLHLL